MRETLLWFATCALIAGLSCGVITWYALRSERWISQWPSTFGEVIESSPGLDRNGPGFQSGPMRWVLGVRYTYWVGDKLFIGDQVSNQVEQFSSSAHSDPPEKLLKHLSSYPVGGRVKVLYNPQHHEKSYLEIDLTASKFFSILTVAFLLAAVAALLLVLKLKV